MCVIFKKGLTKKAIEIIIKLNLSVKLTITISYILNL